MFYVCPNGVTERKKSENKQSDLLRLRECNYVSFVEMSVNRALSKKKLCQKRRPHVSSSVSLTFHVSQVVG